MIHQVDYSPSGEMPDEWLVTGVAPYGATGILTVSNRATGARGEVLNPTPLEWLQATAVPFEPFVIGDPSRVTTKGVKAATVPPPPVWWVWSTLTLPGQQRGIVLVLDRISEASGMVIDPTGSEWKQALNAEKETYRFLDNERVIQYNDGTRKEELWLCVGLWPKVDAPKVVCPASGASGIIVSASAEELDRASTPNLVPYIWTDRFRIVVLEDGDPARGVAQ